MGFLAKWLWLLFLSEATGYGYWFWLANAILFGGILLFVLSVPFMVLYFQIKLNRKMKRGYAFNYDLDVDIEGWYLDSKKDRIVFKNENEEPLQIKLYSKGKFVDSISLDEFYEFNDMCRLYPEKMDEVEVRLKQTKQNENKKN